MLMLTDMPVEIIEIIVSFFLSPKDKKSARNSSIIFYNTIPFMNLRCELLNEKLIDIRDNKISKYLCSNIKCSSPNKLYKRALGIINLYFRTKQTTQEMYTPLITHTYMKRNIPYCYCCMLKYCNIDESYTIIL